MPDPTHSTRPLNKNEELLRKKITESLVSQSDLMDKLSERLLTLELAIPGLYAALLKLVSGEAATVQASAALYVTFACWLAALVLALAAMVPRDWKVDTTLLKQDPEKYKTEGMGMEDFFHQTAAYKRRLVIASSLLLFAGIFSALFTLG